MLAKKKMSVAKLAKKIVSVLVLKSQDQWFYFSCLKDRTSGFTLVAQNGNNSIPHN